VIDDTHFSAHLSVGLQFVSMSVLLHQERSFPLLSHSFGEIRKMIRNRMYGQLPYWRVKPFLAMDLSETDQWWIEHLTSVDGSFCAVSFNNWAQFAHSHPDTRETTWHVEE